MMILRNGGPAYKRAFDIMAGSSSGAVLFHCTAGARHGASCGGRHGRC